MRGAAREVPPLVAGAYGAAAARGRCVTRQGQPPGEVVAPPDSFLSGRLATHVVVHAPVRSLQLLL